MDGYLSTPRVKRAADVIMDQIERLILEGKVRPGQKLPSERSLAEEFDVSRPTVREAIQKLEARGLIQRRHGGGYMGARTDLLLEAPPPSCPTPSAPCVFVIAPRCALAALERQVEPVHSLRVKFPSRRGHLPL